MPRPPQKRVKMKPWSGYQVVDDEGDSWSEAYRTRGQAAAAMNGFRQHYTGKFRIARVTIRESNPRKRGKG